MPGEVSSSRWWCMVKSLLPRQCLLVREGLEKQHACFWVDAVGAITTPPTAEAPLSMAHLWGLVTIIFPITTGSYTRLFTFWFPSMFLVNSLEKTALEMKHRWKLLLSPEINSRFLPAVVWLVFGGRGEGVKSFMDFLFLVVRAVTKPSNSHSSCLARRRGTGLHEALAGPAEQAELWDKPRALPLVPAFSKSCSPSRLASISQQ